MGYMIFMIGIVLLALFGSFYILSANNKMMFNDK